MPRSVIVKGVNDGANPDDLDEFNAFFDDRRLLPANQVRRIGSHRRRLAHRPVERSDYAIGVALFVLSLAGIAAMRATSVEVQHEISGSPWFGAAQLGALASVAVASAVRPFAGRPMQWTTVIVGPWVATILIEGLVLFDPYRGAWLGAVYLVALTGVAATCWVSGIVAAHLQQRHRMP